MIYFSHINIVLVVPSAFRIASCHLAWSCEYSCDLVRRLDNSIHFFSCKKYAHRSFRFLTGAMSHEDAAKVQVGFGRCIYQWDIIAVCFVLCNTSNSCLIIVYVVFSLYDSWPVFAGDTVKKTFKVEKVRNTSDGNHSIINFKCLLVNQRGRLCMSADKRLLFEFPVPESTVDIPPGKLVAT